MMLFLIENVFLSIRQNRLADRNPIVAISPIEVPREQF
jgi:hypothetical protein